MEGNDLLVLLEIVILMAFRFLDFFFKSVCAGPKLLDAVANAAVEHAALEARTC